MRGFLIPYIVSTIDQPLAFITGVLVILGVFIISSASVVISEKNFGITYAYTIRQLAYVAIGLASAFLFLNTPVRFWKRIALPMLLFSLFLLALVFMPGVGFESGGANRWIRLPFMTFQPAEILKFSLIVYLSGWLSSQKTSDKTVGRAFIPFVIIIGVVSVLLILQPDIGTLGVIVITSCLLYFIGGGKITQIAALFVLAVFALFLVIQAAPYRLERLRVFLNPEHDTKGAGYQITQSFIAIGSGGIFGRGFGEGIQKYNYLPEPIGDSIFAIFVEETGFFGATILLFLILAFLWRGIHISRATTDFFSTLLAFGLSTGIAIQSIVHIGAISGLLPLTGIPLPFISYGGTALVVNLASVGVLLNISRNNR